MTRQKPIISFRNVTKRFPGVTALKDVNLDVMPGSCLGLMGENGAGKSTLIKTLAGIHPCDEGEILVDGVPTRFNGPRDALNAGVGVVHQELSFCENMTVAENLCLENMPRRGPFVDKKQMIARAEKMLSAIGANIDPTLRLGSLPISQQQMAQIASAVGSGARVIVFDEPTSSLSQYEAERLFNLIRKLRSDGVTSIYISHRMNEIYMLCDTLGVLRDGRMVGVRPISDMPEDVLVEMMIGRKLEEYFPSHLEAPKGEELLRVENLSSPGKFQNVSFSLMAGEALGFAGLVGSGRTEISEALFGLDPRATGDIYLRGKKTSIRNAAEAIKNGLGLAPEDRKRHGLVLSLSCRHNTTLPILKRIAGAGFVKRAEEEKIVREYFSKMSVKARSMDDPVSSLSGGNQQKIVIARWLAAKCGILMLDEPTRGVDVGSKAEIHGLIDELVRSGSGALIISSELPEVINISTRILVLRNGRIVAEVPREKAEQELLMRHMAGFKSAV